MEVLSFNTFRDGGTIEITLFGGIQYFIGNRLNQKENKVYYAYPKHEHGDKYLASNSDELLKEIVFALKKYKSDYYQPSIDHFVNTYLMEQRDIILDKLNL